MGLKCEFYINMLERFAHIEHVQCPDVKNVKVNYYLVFKSI